MLLLLGVLALALFLFGLVQWARSGASLWTLLRLKRGGRPSSPSERIREESEIHRAEKLTDQLLRSSFRVICVLALGMWLALGIVVLLDLMGIDWIDRLSTRARTFWGSPVYRNFPAATVHTPTRRDNFLKLMGESMRR